VLLFHEAEMFAAPPEETDLRARPVRVVEHVRGTGGQDLTWHPELQRGTPCPHCKKTLQRVHNTVYCAECRARWWSKAPQKL